MLSRAWTQRSRNSIVSIVSVPSLIMSWKPSRWRENFRIVTSGPVSESGGMIALIRLPSGSLASTIAEDSSTRRPTWATILFRIRRRCESSWNLTARLVELALALDPDVVGPVDHDLADGVVCEQPLERTVPEDVIGQIGRQLVALGAREAGLLVQMPPDVGDHALAKRALVDADVEELRPEIADHEQVDAVLQLCERILEPAGA